MSESEVICLAQSGDTEAFSVLYEIHKTNVLNRCRQLLHNEEEAEDVAQDVWLLLFRKIHQFRWKSDFKTWLFKMTTNKIIGHVRHERSRFTGGSEELQEAFTRPNQHTRLEILEKLDTLSEMERFCVEAEGLGQSLRGYGGANYLRSAAKELREVMA